MWLFRKENTGYTGWGDCAVKMKWGTRWPNAKTWEAAGETIAYHLSPPSVKHKRWKPVAKENWSLGRLIRRRYVSSYVDVKTRKNWIQPFKWRRAFKKKNTCVEAVQKNVATLLLRCDGSAFKTKNCIKKIPAQKRIQMSHKQQQRPPPPASSATTMKTTKTKRPKKRLCVL